VQNVINSIRERAASFQKRIALPETECDRTLTAASRAAAAKLADIVLVGSPKYVETRAKALEIDLSGCEVIDPRTSRCARSAPPRTTRPARARV
jgi:phosphotransacetylase